MSESIVEFIGKITPSKPLMSALLAVIPVTEIKGSILYAAASEGELWLSVVAAYLASVRGTDKEATCIRELLSVESADEFKILVDYWRKKGMHDDDTTMAVVTNDYEWMDSLFLRQAEWIW